MRSSSERQVTTATAPGKTILLGEHAVVYGRPAIAVPVSGRRARVSVADLHASTGIRLVARDLGKRYGGAGGCVDDDGRFLQAAVALVLGEMGVDSAALSIEVMVESDIPIARGMGSGAAVSAALMRAVAAHLGVAIAPGRLSELVFATEQMLHGTPSGIDNTTVVYEQPVWFVRGERPEPLSLRGRLTLLIGDTGVPARTRESVAMVRSRHQEAPEVLEDYFDAIGDLVHQAREALTSGTLEKLGPLMDHNHALLVAIGVSSPELELLVRAARDAGALGAKLSGGGMGGCMIALVDDRQREPVRQALQSSGATQVILTEVSGEAGDSGLQVGQEWYDAR